MQLSPQTKTTCVAVVVLGILGWQLASSGQAVRPTPGPGTGIVTVTGSVDIGDMPIVRAAQSGDWRVAVANTPTVALLGPEFLKTPRRYRVTWPSGGTETINAVQLGSPGWARVEGTGPRRWVNLAAAQAIEELDGR